MAYQPPSRIAIEELFKLPSIWGVSASWSGDSIAYYSNRTGRLELYHMDLRTREETKLTDGEAPSHLMAGFVWTRDDRSIIFAKDKDGDEQHNLFRLDIDHRSVAKLNDDPRSQDYPGQVSPDNRTLLVASNRAGQMNLFAFDLETHTWTQLTNYASPTEGGKWSPKGDRIVFTTNETDDLRNNDIYLMDADGSNRRKILSVQTGSNDRAPGWHPEGRYLAVTSDATGVNQPGILDVESGEIRWHGQPGVEEYASRFSADGRWLLALRERDSTILPVLYDVATGAERTLQLPSGVVDAPQFVLDQTKLLFTFTTANRREEVLLYDLDTNHIDTVFPAEYGSIDPSVFVTDTYVRYPSTQGAEVPALLYAPREIHEAERLPAVVYVHGGPTWQWYRGFEAAVQCLVDQGYVVLLPNVRGSTGYGVEWRDACLRDWGGKDLEDISAGVSYLKQLPYVDGDRIGIYGISYGGYMSYISVTKEPDLFKVGAPFVGMSDLHALYSESMDHYKYYLRQQMGDPEDDAALWKDRSATTHVDQLKAKMLIAHGVYDPRCPISQARIFRDRLLEVGKREGVGPEDDFEYHEFQEGHGAFGDSEGEIRNFKLLVDFLKRRL